MYNVMLKYVIGFQLFFPTPNISIYLLFISLLYAVLYQLKDMSMGLKIGWLDFFFFFFLI